MSEETHTHTHTLTALCPGLPGWAGTRKVKPIWILLKQETVSGSGISWAICKSAPRSRQITMLAPHRSVFFTGRMPFLPPNQRCQSMKAFQKKTNCNPLAYPTGKCHHTKQRIAKTFSSDWRFTAFFQNAGGSEESQFWVVVSGSEKNRLWCVATGMSGKQWHSKCSEWPPSARIHASSLFWHWSVAQYTTLCWNLAHVATSRCRITSISIHALLLQSAPDAVLGLCRQ